MIKYDLYFKKKLQQLETKTTHDRNVVRLITV